MSGDILVVNRVEHHAFQSCPCDDCCLERRRRASTSSKHVKLKPHEAHQLGFIKTLTPEGSKVRKLQAELNQPSS